jgi:methylglutaconyl-CoA hydratase
MFMPNEVVQVKVVEPVGTIVLSRENRRNALSRAMIDELRQALSDLHLERRVRAIVLTGAGSAFCAGRDVHEMAAEDQQANAQQRWGEEAERFRELVVDMLELPKPIIAAVNGPALGSGAGLVLACDIVIASHGAKFGLPDPRLGVVAGVVAPLLAFRVGAGPAARLLLTGEQYDAAEAYRLGIYHELVEHDLLWARGVQIGKSCAAGAPEAVQLTKRLLTDTIGEQLMTQLTSGAIASAAARSTEAAKEGLAAFLEKRTPVWK